MRVARMAELCLIAMMAVTTAQAQLPEQSIYSNTCVPPTGGVFAIDPTSTEQGDGQFVTSHGQLKVIFIMIEGEDDGLDVNNAWWPTDGNGQPFWVTNPDHITTPTAQYAATNWLPGWNPELFTLTDYFYRMSVNQTNPDDRLRVYGDFFHVVTPRTRQEALNQGFTLGQTIVEAMVFPPAWLTTINPRCHFPFFLQVAPISSSGLYPVPESVQRFDERLASRCPFRG